MKTDVASQSQRSLRPLAVVLMLLILTIVSGASVYVLRERKDLERAVGDQLSTVAHLKVARLAAWRQEYLSDGRVLSESPFVARSVDLFFGDAAAEAQRESLLQWMAALSKHRGYEEVLLLDPRLKVRLAFPAASSAPEPATLKLAEESLRTGQVMLSDLHRSLGSSNAQVVVFVPLFRPHPKSGIHEPPSSPPRGPAEQLVGMVLFRIEPGRFLESLLQSWPTSGATAETLLVRREGDQVVFLNGAQRRADTEPWLGIPIAPGDSVEARAGLGLEGFLQGRDYRGVPVVAAVRQIPDSDWYLVAKMNRAEAYAPLREKAGNTGLTAAALLLCVALLARLARRRQQAQFLARELVAERERRRVADALRESESRYRLLFESNPQPMFVYDVQTLAIQVVNDAAIEHYGYAREEFLSLSLKDLHLAEDQAVVEQSVRTLQGELRRPGIWRHKTRDGTLIDAEVTTHDIQIESRCCRLALVNDITERLRAEEAVRESYNRLHQILQQMPYPVQICNRDGIATEVNQAFLAMFGVDSADQIVGRFNVFTHPLIAELGVLGDIRRAYEGEVVFLPKVTMPSSQIRLESTSGITGDKVSEVTMFPVFRGLGEVWQVVTIWRDITERKQAEAALASEQHLLHSLMDNLPDHIYFKDAESRFTRINQAQANHLGLAEPAQALGKTDFDFFSEAHARPAYDDEQEIVRGGQPLVNKEERETWPGRPDTWASTTKAPLRDKEGRIIGTFGVSRDITERKLAAEALWKSETRYRSLFTNMLEGFAYCRMIFEDDRPQDFVYLEVNGAFEKLTELKDVVGRKVTEVMPGIRKSHPELFEIYGRVALTGQPERFEVYLEELDGKCLSVSAYCPEKGRFVAVFDNITERKRSEERLRQLSSAVEQSPASVVITDTQGNIEYINPKFEELTGYTLEEVRGKNPRVLKSGQTPPEVYADLWRTITADGEWRGEFHNRRKNGSLFWEAAVISGIKDEAGHLTHFLGVKEDVTQRKQAEERLRSSEERLRLLFEFAPDAYVLYDLAGNIVDGNKAAEALVGYTRDELIGKNFFQVNLIAAEDAPRAAARLAQYSEGLIPSPQELSLIRKDGTRVPVEIRMYLVTMDGRRLVLGIARDMTERKRADARIREQAALLDKAPDAILVLDLQHRITYWNRGATELYGWTAEEALGCEAQSLIAQDAEACQKARHAVIEQGEWFGELTQTTRSGKQAIVQSRWSLVRDEAGAPRSVLSINTDITEQKKLEHHLLQAQRLESIGTLAGGVAHDLNNILAPIIMSADLITASLPPADSESADWLAIIRNSAQRGADIVRQLLTFARGIEGDRMLLQPLYLVREMDKVARGSFPKSIRVETRLGKDLWTVVGDATQLHQVLLNLCVNARDAMPNGGILTLSAENAELDNDGALAIPGARRGRYVRLQVSDTGTGILPEIRDKVFDPFFTTKAPGKGTGLGLSTVLGIVNSYDGFIQIRSEVGRGAEFSVYLPTSRESGTATRTNAAVTPPRNGGGLVLVVEDEAPIREVVQKVLERHGHTVITASDGAEAIIAFVQHREDIKLVITDIVMPNMDGLEMSRALRKLAPQLGIIVASGEDRPETQAELSALGIRTLLLKPYDAPRLLSAVHEAFHGNGWQ